MAPIEKRYPGNKNFQLSFRGHCDHAEGKSAPDAAWPGTILGDPGYV